MNLARTILIDPLSLHSLMLEVCANGNQLGVATGFVVQVSERPCLITNWHVVSGIDPQTGQMLSPSAGVPDELRIIHHASVRLGSWVRRSEPLRDATGSSRWLEHPRGSQVDVVAVPLSSLDSEVKLYPLDLRLANMAMVPRPGMPVFIIGFPFGLAAAGSIPIWKTGHIASDPDLDYGGQPAFLIDATTRSGMSGSPVILRLTGGYESGSGMYTQMGPPTTKFLGIYSGRIHGQAEIGKVWRPSLIEEIVSARTGSSMGSNTGGEAHPNTERA
jgi:hypothetical protein